MLHPDPSRRPTARQLLDDPWISKDTVIHDDPLSSGEDDAAGRETVEESHVRIAQIERKQIGQIDIDMQLAEIQKQIDILAKMRKQMSPAKFKGNFYYKLQIIAQITNHLKCIVAMNFVQFS